MDSRDLRRGMVVMLAPRLHNLFVISAIAAMFLYPVAAFAITYSPGQTLDPACLPTDPTCIVVAAPAYIAGAFQATSTTATSTFAGNISVSGTATTTSFFGAGLFACTSGNFVTWTGGLFGCAADQTGGGGGVWPFTAGLSNYGVPVQATTTPGWFQNGLMASSTSYFVNASTTNLTAFYASSTQGFFGSLSVGSLSGFLKATAGAVATALIDLANDVTGILGVSHGGTGWANIAASAIPYGNGSSALATTTAGTAGYVLAYLNGVPTWAATTTLNNGTGISTSFANGTWTITNTGATFAFPFTTLATYGTTTAATSSSIQTAGVFFASSTVAASVFPYASTTALSATTFCLTGDTCRTTWPTSGAWPFTTGLSNFGVAVQATTTPAWFQNGMMASSTSYFVYASTTALTVSGRSYLTGGFLSLASSTIGDGTQAGGLTISGGATTTLNAYFASKVGIGTTSPFALLSVSGGDTRLKETTDSQTALVIENSVGSSTLQVSTQDTSSNIFEIATSTGTAYFDVTSGGFVGVSTTSPWRKFSVTGTVGLDGLSSSGGTATLCLSDNKEVVTNNGACTSSSEFFKHDIMALSLSGIELMSALTPASFVYNNDTSSTTRWGFIAQQLASTSPHFIDYYDAAGNPRTIDTTSILAVAVKAIQELITQVRDLAATVAGFADHFTTKELTFTRAIGDEITVKKVCVQKTDGTPVCVTGDQLAAILAGAGQSAAPASSSTSNTPPTILIAGENPAHIRVGDTYNDLGATITAPEADLNLGIHTFVGSTPIEQAVIDTSAPATYHIYYVVTGSAGITATSTRTVIVEAASSSPPTSPSDTSAATSSAASSTNSAADTSAATTTQP